MKEKKDHKSDYTENQPLLSVLVPVFNVEPYLDRCVSSIVNQTYHNLEIILVDDGSTDASWKMCDEWAKRDQRIISIHRKNGGLVEARKAAAQVATGMYVTVVDSDDWIEEDMCEILMDAVLMNDADMVTSGIVKDYKNHSVRVVDAILPGVYEGAKLKNELLSQLVSRKDFFVSKISAHIPHKVFRREQYVFYQSQVDSGIRFGEGTAVVYPLLFHAKKVVVLNDCCYHYCVRDNSICGTVVDDPVGAEALTEHLNRQIADLGELRPTAEQQMRIFQAYSRAFTCPDTFFRVCNGILYPYDVNVHQKILVYGGGKFGQRLKGFLEKHPEFQIVAWTDKIQKEGYVSVAQALSMDYDVILIAVALAAPADEICRELIGQGVDENKLRRIEIRKILEMT